MRYLIICVSVWTVAVGDNFMDILSTMDTAPPYVDSFESLKRNFEEVISLLPFEDLVLTDVRRHFAIVAGVLAGLVEYLNSDCNPPDYDHEYLPAVDVMVPMIWQDPISAAKKIKNFIKDTYSLVEVINDLKKYYCRDISTTSCDKILHIIIHESDIYEKAAALDLLGGELAKLYEENVNFIENFQEFNIVPLLIKGKNKFKPIVFKAAEMYRIMYGKVCQP